MCDIISHSDIIYTLLFVSDDLKTLHVPKILEHLQKLQKNKIK